MTFKILCIFMLVSASSQPSSGNENNEEYLHTICFKLQEIRRLLIMLEFLFTSRINQLSESTNTLDLTKITVTPKNNATFWTATETLPSATTNIPYDVSTTMPFQTSITILSSNVLQSVPSLNKTLHIPTLNKTDVISNSSLNVPLALNEISGGLTVMQQGNESKVNFTLDSKMKSSDNITLPNTSSVVANNVLNVALVANDTANSTATALDSVAQISNASLLPITEIVSNDHLHNQKNLTSNMQHQSEMATQSSIYLVNVTIRTFNVSGSIRADSQLDSFATTEETDYKVVTTTRSENEEKQNSIINTNNDNEEEFAEDSDASSLENYEDEEKSSEDDDDDDKLEIPTISSNKIAKNKIQKINTIENSSPVTQTSTEPDTNFAVVCAITVNERNAQDLCRNISLILSKLQDLTRKGFKEDVKDLAIALNVLHEDFVNVSYKLFEKQDLMYDVKTDIVSIIGTAKKLTSHAIEFFERALNEEIDKKNHERLVLIIILAIVSAALLVVLLCCCITLKRINKKEETSKRGPETPARNSICQGWESGGDSTNWIFHNDAYEPDMPPTDYDTKLDNLTREKLHNASIFLGRNKEFAFLRPIKLEKPFYVNDYFNVTRQLSETFKEHPDVGIPNKFLINRELLNDKGKELYEEQKDPYSLEMRAHNLKRIHGGPLRRIDL